MAFLSAGKKRSKQKQQARKTVVKNKIYNLNPGHQK